MLRRDLRETIPNLFFRRLVYAGIATLFLCVLVIPIFVVYMRKEPKYDSTEYGSTNATRLDLSITITSVDTINLKSQLNVDFFPYGNLITQGGSKLNQSISVNFLYKVFNFPQNSSFLLPSGELSIPFVSGDRQNYPFDVYEAKILLYITTPGTLDDDLVPVSCFVYTSAQNFEIYSNFDSDMNELSFLMTRSATTKGFSICVVILMWALSLGLGTVAFQIVFLRREIQPPVIALGVSMLFSLPALRNTQPGVPGIGCATDIIGFFWNMLLVAISSIGIIWTYSITWTRPLPQRPSTPLAMETTTTHKFD